LLLISLEGFIMKIQRLIQSTLLAVVGALVSHIDMPAQANTLRGQLGISSGSEVVNSFQPNFSVPAGGGTTIGQTVGSAVAAETTKQAILALREGKSFGFGEGATVSLVTTTNSDGSQTTAVKLNLASANGTTVSKEFAAGNTNAASRVGGIVAGVLAGLGSTKASMWDQAIAVASKAGSVEKSGSVETVSLESSQLASRLTGILSLMEKQTQRDGLSENEVANAIAAYNEMIKASSGDMLVVLSQQPEFVAIRSQLIEMRKQFKK
jgi:hypothetical protein